jgi:hypothetical protein
MSSSSGSSEHQNANRHADKKDHAHKFPMGTGLPWELNYILAKNLSTFCPCPECSNEAELKSKIPRQHKIQPVAWLLLAAFSLIYSENWEHKAEQKDF